MLGSDKVRVPAAVSSHWSMSAGRNKNRINPSYNSSELGQIIRHDQNWLAWMQLGSHANNPVRRSPVGYDDVLSRRYIDWHVER